MARFQRTFAPQPAVRRLLDYLFDDQQGHPVHRAAGFDSGGPAHKKLDPMPVVSRSPSGALSMMNADFSSTSFRASRASIGVRELRPAAGLRWHMVGRLQRNKAGERDDPLGVLVQVSLDGDPSRGGAPTLRAPNSSGGLVHVDLTALVLSSRHPGLSPSVVGAAPVAAVAAVVPSPPRR